MKKQLTVIFSLLAFVSFGQGEKDIVSNDVCSVTLDPSPTSIWQYHLWRSNKTIDIEPPVFEIDGKLISGMVSNFKIGRGATFNNSVSEYIAEGRLRQDSSIQLSIRFRIAAKNPVVRFSYQLTSNSTHHFSKKMGMDNLKYFSVSFAKSSFAREIRLSDFNEKDHATTLTENAVAARLFEDGQSVMGPILLGGDDGSSFLLAYEHGSQFPERFLEFQLTGKRNVSLRAVKGNYLNHQLLDKANGFQTIWFEIAAVSGNEDSLAGAYREFVLKYMTTNKESRKPYIFYNTWGRQERVKWAGGSYLSSMNLETTLREIEVAHQMGIEVYVLDVGWFKKTGDWEVNTEFFPDTLKQVKALLDKYQMKLGLWVNPLLAAKTSTMLAQNRQNAVVWNGKADDPFPIWETEESVRLSLVSPYWRNLAAKLISLVKQYGVSYIKWDGIWQHGANGTGHFYGSEENSVQERDDSYAFQLPIYMGKIVDMVSDACPLTIFDFDITEEGRSVGLQFLSSGKYFIMNNGPYFHSYDLALPWKSPLSNGNANIFVNPGPARGWFLRSILSYDKWIPSVLFLTHYQPDGLRNSQIINIASLVLGQNGIWGELLKLSPEDIALFHNVLGKYKQVRNDITESNPIVTGAPGLSPEIYEKINVATGKGAVVLFANTNGTYTYITENKVDRINWHTDDVVVRYDEKDRAMITVQFTEPGAKIVFFGAK